MFNLLKKLYNYRLIISRIIRLRYYLFLLKNTQRQITNTKQNSQDLISKKHDSESQHRIAILLIGKGIGDAIVLSGFMNILKKYSYEISIICYDRLMPTIPSILSMVSEFIVVSKHDSAFRYLFNKKKFDIVVDFYDPDIDFDHNKVKLFLMLDCPVLIGFNQDKEKYDFSCKSFIKHCSLNDIYTESYHYDENKPFCDRVTFLLNQYFGINTTASEYMYQLDVADSISNLVFEYITDLKNRNLFNNKKSTIVVFNTVSSDKYRSLSTELVNEVCDYLINCNNDYLIILLNFKNDDLCVKSKKIIINPFKTFAEVVALIKFSDFLISPDTSIVHVGCCFNKNAIYIYNNRKLITGHENNIVWGPIGEHYLQIFADEKLNTFQGDDLRKIKFDTIKRALIKKNIT